MRCAALTSNLWNGGNMWCGWVAYLSFFRHVSKLPLDYSKWQHYEAAAVHGSYRFMHKKFWIVCDFPTVVGRDAQNRPHSDTGPHLAWRDGWKLYAVHGVRVPADIIEDPTSITVARIDAEQNAEVRRVMLERFGAARFMRESGAKAIHQDRFGVLYRRELAGDEPIVMVRLLNTTPEPDGMLDEVQARAAFGDVAVNASIALAQDRGIEVRRWKEYMIRVPPDMQRAKQAVAWTAGMSEGDYSPRTET
jgi:hypothetical protein